MILLHASRLDSKLSSVVAQLFISEHTTYQKRMTMHRRIQPEGTFLSMIASNQRRIFPALLVLVSFILLSGVCPLPLSGFDDDRRRSADYQSLRPQKELRRLNKIKTHLGKINKPSVKTIQASIVILYQLQFSLFPFWFPFRAFANLCMDAPTSICFWPCLRPFMVKLQIVFCCINNRLLIIHC